jgi:hypothetical protein
MRAVTFGSDAHVLEALADNFPEAMAMVEHFGFRPGRRPEDFWTRASPRRPESALRLNPPRSPELPRRRSCASSPRFQPPRCPSTTPVGFALEISAADTECVHQLSELT